MTAQRMARRIIIGIVAAVCFGAALAGSVWAQSAADSGGGTVLVARMDHPIDSLAAGEIRSWINRAQDLGAPLLVIELDTPGGRLDSAREIAVALMDSPVPVAVLVTPSGARAASAGVFILAAAHVAAMSPGTTVGAATPVDAGGNDLNETLKEKASQDAAAFLRDIATRRGRDSVASSAFEKTIFDAAAYSASEARGLGIIDIVARDSADLIAQASGMKINAAGATLPDALDAQPTQTLPESPTDGLMRWLSNPQIVFILLAIGGVLIVIELSAPGGFTAGLLGGTLILGAVIGMTNLPVNWLALGLMLLGTGFFVAEFQSAGWGAFGAAGAVCFLLGGFLLFGDYATAPGIAAPAVRVGYWTLGGVAVFFAVSVVGLWYFSRKVRKIRVPPKAEEIIGKTGFVRNPLFPRGTVQVGGELWTAESDDGELIGRNEFIVVSEIRGLTLIVFRQSVIDAEKAANDCDCGNECDCAP